MNHAEAAALLGVPSDADADEVRRAWRVWARIAHPDAGGDPEHFARLDQARRIMLVPRPGKDIEPVPHRPLRGVLKRPPHPGQLIVAAIIALGVATLPSALSATLPTTLVLAAIPAALAATGWALWATRALMTPAADRGHRISMLALTWGALAGGQLAVSALTGVSLLPVLPVLALPIAAAVAMLDPGTGLWR